VPSSPAAALPNDGVVRVLRDRKGRGGKTVTLVAGVPGGAAALAETAARLKRLCGSGGTVRDGAIEIQGDHRERIAEALRAQGLTVKLAGG
jgi:translation initiation factor 1